MRIQIQTTNREIMEYEFTGDYEQCQKCNHIWDYMDTACPNCGNNDVEMISSEGVNEQLKLESGNELIRLRIMLRSHGDLN